ncbi:hypothetical protein [Brachyspira intermedia]|uniref:hypothetical protein n=1 Tax=Brachyspira intermedia TaxID=84377 RepID=UPI003007BEF2
MKKINIHFIFALSLICLFYLNQNSYAQSKQNTIRVSEYGTGINKSWNDRFDVYYIKGTLKHNPNFRE